MSAERLDSLRVFVVDGEPVYKEGMRAILEPDYRLEETGEQPLSLILRACGLFNPAIVIIGRLSTLRAKLDLMEGIKKDIGLPILTLFDSEEQNYHISKAARFSVGFVRRNCQPEVLKNAVRSVTLGTSFIDQDIAQIFIDSINAPKVNTKESASDNLSDREREVLELAAKGRSNRIIASALNLSIKTVETHIRNIAVYIRQVDGYGEMGLNSRNLLLVYAALNGMITKPKK